MSGPVSFLLDLLFPPRCVFCRKLLKHGERELCAHCRAALPWTQGAEAVQTGEFFSLCVSPLWYHGEVRNSFHRYKFKERTDYAKPYGGLMAQCVQTHLPGRYDLITWVPLSAKSFQKRGYDQAMLLAMAVGLALDSVAVETLTKPRVTDVQSSLPEDAARRANVLGAYEAADVELIAGKRILLIDDIITTGSTLSECARVLRTAEASDVVCCTLARARKDAPQRNH